MRDVIKKMIEDAVIFRYELPNEEIKIQSSEYSSISDKCYENQDIEKISELIYNSIVEYANNEYDINYNELDKEQLRTIITKLRYNEDGTETSKLKYGFYGEVLLYVILAYFFGTEIIIAKGRFYNILDASEPKGYDCFHLIQREDKVELWFGEAKCYQDYDDAINSVIDGLAKAISDNYLNQNFIALIREEQNFNIRNSQIEQICNNWKDNPRPNILEEIVEHDMKLVYPVLIVADNKAETYDNYIEKCIQHIKKKYEEKQIVFDTRFSYDIFFIFLSVDDVKRVKGQVIKWISEKEPLK